VKKQTWKI